MVSYDDEESHTGYYFPYDKEYITFKNIPIQSLPKNISEFRKRMGDLKTTLDSKYNEQSSEIKEGLEKFGGTKYHRKSYKPIINILG